MKLICTDTDFIFLSEHVNHSNNGSWLVRFTTNPMRQTADRWDFKIYRRGRLKNSGHVLSEPSRLMAESLIRNYDQGNES